MLANQPVLGYMSVAILAAVSIPFVASAVKVAGKVNWPSRWDVGRFARGVRHAIGISPFPEFAYLVAIALLIIGLAAFLSDWATASTCLAVGSAIALGLAAITDVVSRLRVMHGGHAWAAKAMLVFWGWCAGAAGFLTFAMSRHLVRALTGEDAKLFPDATQLGAVITYPLAVSIVCLFTIAFILAFELLVLCLFTTGSQLLSVSALLLPQLRSRVASAAGRLFLGYARHSPWHTKFTRHAHLIFRPLAIGLLGWAVAAPTSFVYGSVIPQTEPYLRAVIALIEFSRNGGRCTALQPDAYVFKMDGNRVLVAEGRIGTMTFTRKNCDKHADLGRADG